MVSLVTNLDARQLLYGPRRQIEGRVNHLPPYFLLTPLQRGQAAIKLFSDHYHSERDLCFIVADLIHAFFAERQKPLEGIEIELLLSRAQHLAYDQILSPDAAPLTLELEQFSSEAESQLGAIARGNHYLGQMSRGGALNQKISSDDLVEALSYLILLARFNKVPSRTIIDQSIDAYQEDIQTWGLSKKN